MSDRTIADLHIDGWTREQDALPELDPKYGPRTVLAWHPLEAGPRVVRYSTRGWEEGHPWPSPLTFTHWREIR